MNISKEDYIKAIYELGGEDKIVGNKVLSERLKISPPSVSEMIKKLVEDGYVVYEQYKGVRLTKKGLDMGKSIRKRHLLWEVFLVDKLGYEWDEIHAIAENLEHFTDQKLEKRLEVFLGNPKYCPHGNPIYSGDDLALERLSTASKLGYFIRRIRDEGDVLVFASSQNIKIGDYIRVLDRMDGKILIEHGDRQILLDDFLTDKIYVEEEKI